MKHIYLIRHAQSHSNAGGDAMPNADIPLTELGKQQAEQVAHWLIERLGDSITSIGISKYLRTAETALPLSQLTGIAPTVIAGLEEFNYLSFASIADKSLTERRRLADDYWLTFAHDDVDGTDAESFNQFVERVQAVQDYFNQLPNGNHVVFAHGLWLSMLIWLMLGQATDSNHAMQRFRQFETSVRLKNTEGYLLTIADNAPPAITKVRTRGKDFIHLITE